MSIFHTFDITKPAVNLINTRDAGFALDLRKSLIYYKSFYKSQLEFNETCVLLSKLIVRRKNSFIKFHGFNETCKVNSALCRLLKVNITDLLENFIDMIPAIILDDCESKVPSRNNLDYVLIRTVSYYEILKRLSSCCLNAGEYFIKLLAKGFFVEILTLNLAVISKLYALVNNIGNKTVDLYDTLRTNRNKFPEANIKFFKEVKFPEALEKFETVVNTSRADENNKIRMKVVEEKPFIPIPSTGTGKKVEDFGIIAEFNLESFTTINHISAFFKEENMRRKEKSCEAITSKISFGDWKMITSVVSKKILGNDEKNAVSVFKRLMKKYLK